MTRIPTLVAGRDTSRGRIVDREAVSGPGLVRPTTSKNGDLGGTLLDAVAVVVLTGVVAAIAARGPWRSHLLGHPARSSPR